MVEPDPNNPDNNNRDINRPGINPDQPLGLAPEEL